MKAQRSGTSGVLMEGSFYPYRCVRVRLRFIRQFGPAARWSQSGTNAAADQIPNRHPLRPRLPCIAQVTARHTTATKTEVTRGARPRPPQITIAVTDPRGTTRRLRSDVDGVVAVPDRRCALTDGPDLATGTEIATATERDRADTPEETDRGRGRAADLARGTRGEVVVVIAAGTGTDTERAVDTTPGRPLTSPTPWRITAMARERRCTRRQRCRSRTPSRMTVVLWRCSRRCRSKCSRPHRNPPRRC